MRKFIEIINEAHELPEHKGWVVKRDSSPYVFGPFSSKEEAYSFADKIKSQSIVYPMLSPENIPIIPKRTNQHKKDLTVRNIVRKPIKPSTYIRKTDIADSYSKNIPVQKKS